MAGVGTLPIEAALHFGVKAIGCDVDPRAISLARKNLEAAQPYLSSASSLLRRDGDDGRNIIHQSKNEIDQSENVDVSELVSFHEWDVCEMPLDDASVDAVVVDMPFGLTCDLDRRMYPRAFEEIGRVTRRGGRVVILGMSKGVVMRSVKEGGEGGTGSAWEIRELVDPVNVGGLNAFVMVLEKR
eukprot:1195194-Prorocentrum_minimum.AAC.2